MTTTEEPTGPPTTRRRALDAWVAITLPRADGLPNRWVLGWFPSVVLLVLAVLVLTSLTGSSTGMFWSLIGRGEDPSLLAGVPRGVRSDEWLVQSGWVVSQVSEGFPATNQVFPGGMDATVMNDLPAWHWSAVFRPHTWGFLLLGLDHGMAVRWWLPAALMVVTAYALVVSLLPRRPGLAAVLALTTVFQPLVQWWWLPIVPLPAAFAFATMTAAIWGTRARSRPARWLPAVLAGYLAVATAMGIYVPFILPALLAAAAFVVGHALSEWRGRAQPLRAVLLGLAPLALAGTAAGVVSTAWYVDRRAAFTSLLGTVYPGQRLTPPGTGGSADLVALLSAPFQRSLALDVSPGGGGIIDGLGPNQSEASSVLLLSVFLLVPLAGVLVRRLRTEHRVDWLILALLGVHAVVLAFLFVPGWDALAHLVGLDRGTPQRMRLVFVVLAVVAVAVLVERLEQLERRATWLASLVAGGAALLASAWVWQRLDEVGSDVVPSRFAVAVTVLLAAGIVLLSRRHPTPGAILVLVAAVVVGGGVNPLYRGVLDLSRDSEAGRAVVQLAADDGEATFVGVGSYLSMATLVESGVTAYSGVQTYPSSTMWDQIDPAGTHEEAWNRLAHVTWVPGRGAPEPRQPTAIQADVVQMTFDSCASFAQEHVTFVLVDQQPLDQRCVEEVASFQQGAMPQWIYRVVDDPRP